MGLRVWGDPRYLFIFTSAMAKKGTYPSYNIYGPMQLLYRHRKLAVAKFASYWHWYHNSVDWTPITTHGKSPHIHSMNK